MQWGQSNVLRHATCAEALAAAPACIAVPGMAGHHGVGKCKQSGQQRTCRAVARCHASTRSGWNARRTRLTAEYVKLSHFCSAVASVSTQAPVQVSLMLSGPAGLVRTTR